MVAMAIMIITSILSMRGLPSEAKFGVQSIFYYVFAAIVFLLPYSLVCAELASTYTKPRLTDGCRRHSVPDGDGLRCILNGRPS